MRREQILYVTVMSTKQHTARHSLTTTTYMYMLPGLRLDVLERMPGTESAFHSQSNTPIILDREYGYAAFGCIPTVCMCLSTHCTNTGTEVEFTDLVNRMYMYRLGKQ